ncbi:ATP-dependent zinc protease family protein [Hymenobacter cavernae]|uniref:Retropepsin-like aspartic endopeptidase domain-containing protein n=1 Tax=Hymenobacter cavernae TaxID=2044852 RepID=A0ABQ1UCH2_9BACT|nr:RimK/LysX family protein [Hymenobacter cavernae]GGF14698.1 hypothetical protein GCM10011383_27380 [Hymenobacter cavernae]
MKKRTIGRLELVDFPQFEIEGVEAKIDTGAYTGAIHCNNIQLVKLADGQASLRVNLLDDAHPNFDGCLMEFTDFSLRTIKSSTGEAQRRYVIRTVIRLFGEDFTTQFSLSDRSDMKYPVLIGRSLLRRGRFLVDVSKRYVGRKKRFAPGSLQS